MAEAVIVAGARTPIGKLSGALGGFTAMELGGFAIAEADLKLRGPGELLGQQQSGAMNLRFGDLLRDLALIRQARELAANL